MIIEEVADRAPEALESTAGSLPRDFPLAVVDAVAEAITDRVRGLRLAGKVQDQNV